jgi:hypothetical protein
VTVTVDGTLAAVGLELVSDTTAPLVPAADVRITVPMPDCPLTMLLGLTEMPLRADGAGSMVTSNIALALE